jgi:flavorubredoxin
MDSKKADLSKPVRIAEDTYWVGKRDASEVFHSNPYLRIFPRASGEQGGALSMLIDPGSSSDFAVVCAKVNALIGHLKRLSVIFINHQDPDVGSSAAVIAGRYAPNTTIVCSEETWRLIVHFNLPRKRFLSTNKSAKGLRFKTGHRMIPVPTPFCHFRGAVALYDPQTCVLFSGDLFGGLTPGDALGMWADEGDWSGIRAFHQMYMPSNAALARAVATIRGLYPPVKIIAPQHGRLIRGALLDEFMNRLASLPVGLDLIEEEEDESTLTAWNTVLGRILNITKLFGDGAEEVLQRRGELADTMSFAEGECVITGQGRWTVERVVALLCAERDADTVATIKMEAIFAADELHLPAPRISLTESVQRDDDIEELVSVVGAG